MNRTPTTAADPLEREIERALLPGVFIGWRESSSFVSDLAEVAAQIASLTRADSQRAVALYETFLAACHEKAEELDDSGGNFAEFVRQLFTGWIKARQTASADPEQTASRLLNWMDDDPYGLCHGSEVEIAKALGRSGLAAFEAQVRERHDRYAKQDSQGTPVYLRRRWRDVLRMIRLERKDVAGYIALAEEAGLTAQDCRNVAGMLAARRRYQEALDWVERGLALDKQTPDGSMAGVDLNELKRDLLKRLGRPEEALASA